MNVGFVRAYKGKKVVVVKTGLNADGADAVVVARLSSTKPSGTTPSVEAKTIWARYWVLVKQVQTVKAADLVSVWYGPEKLDAALVKEIQKGIE